MLEFKHKDVWTTHGKGFCVEVVRWERELSISEESWSISDTNIWNIYAYIYPSHTLFNKLKRVKRAGDCYKFGIPFTRDISYFNKNQRENKICSIQIGNDYNHLGDEYFTRCSTKDEASSIFFDAEELFKYLEKLMM